MDKSNFLEEKYQALKHEVDSIQVALLNNHPPWYKNIPVIVSILALVFSFATTTLSFQRNQLQDLLERKSELRDMLKTLAQLPTKNLEVMKKYQGDENIQALIGGQINQENSILVSQAVELINNIPESHLTAIELYSIGVSLQNAYQNDSALAFFNKSERIAIDFNSNVSAKRGIANTLFLLGRIQEGRQAFQETIAVFDEFPGFNEFIQQSTHVQTYILWASVEAATLNFDVAEKHLEKANSIVLTLTPGPFTSQLNTQILHLETQILNAKSHATAMNQQRQG